MIRIDEQKCTDCSACHEVCPSYVFCRNETAEKKTSVRYSDLCCSCGHCISICPADAVTHEGLLAEDFIDLRGPKIETSDLQNLILSRRSIRKYKEKQVPDELIDLLIESGVHAGSGGNVQSEIFGIIKDKALLDRMEPEVIDIIWNGGIKFFTGKGLLQKVLSKKVGPILTKQYEKYNKIIRRRRENNDTEGVIFRGAPAVIYIHGLKENYLAQTNCAIALRNIELMAQTMGLGSCHAGFMVSAAEMKQKRINKMLGIDNSRQIFGALMIGYPKYKYKQRVPRDNRETIRLVEK